MKTFSLASRLGFGSDSSSTNGQENLNTDSTTTKDTAMDYGMVTGNISSMPSVKRMVVETALNKLFSERHFSVCTLDTVMKVMNISDKSDAYKQLHALHCVDYADMSDDMRQVLPMLVNEALKLPVINMATQEALKGVSF